MDFFLHNIFPSFFDVHKHRTFEWPANKLQGYYTLSSVIGSGHVKDEKNSSVRLPSAEGSLLVVI